MPNLELATYIDMQRITPGSAFTLSFHAHEQGGNNFHWTNATGGPYTPKAKLTVGTVTIAVTGTVVSAAGGTATAAWTAAQTTTLAANAWGEITLYADPNTGSENLAIGVVQVQTAAEVIP